VSQQHVVNRGERGLGLRELAAARGKWSRRRSTSRDVECCVSEKNGSFCIVTLLRVEGGSSWVVTLLPYSTQGTF
jgi:hypothetical protein